MGRGPGGPFDLLYEQARWTITGNCLAAGAYASRDEFLGRVIRPFDARMRQGLKPEILGLHEDSGTVIVRFDAEGVAGGEGGGGFALRLCMRRGKPRCSALVRSRAACRERSVALSDSASIMVAEATTIAPGGRAQERRASPSTCTVQAPHWATPQPSILAVRPARSRMTRRRGVSASPRPAAGRR